jgi:hypothetical protein
MAISLPASGAIDLPRAVLRLDGATVAASGLLVSVGSRPIADFLGWGEPLALVGLGLAFVVYGAALLWDAARPTIERRMVLVPALINAAWVLGSAEILITGRPALSTGGAWAVGLVALAVELIAVAQFVAWRRMR